jgi:hypothetical protein
MAQSLMQPETGKKGLPSQFVVPPLGGSQFVVPPSGGSPFALPPLGGSQFVVPPLGGRIHTPTFSAKCQ